MTKNINNAGKIIVLAIVLFSGQLLAQKNEPILNFKFNHLTNIKSSEHASLTDTDAQVSQTLPFSDNNLKFAAYDATWTYPWETKSMNIDLGVTLRHLSGSVNSVSSLDSYHFRQVLPLLHASALFSLPLEGLSAGIEGSHLGSSDTQIFDYRAKVSYEWRKGFGLQGGWQHQQFSLDTATDIGADYERNGPFIDFYLNF